MIYYPMTTVFSNEQSVTIETLETGNIIKFKKVKLFTIY